MQGEKGAPMLTEKEHAALLGAFDLPQLLQLVGLGAKKHHSGGYAILAFNSGFKVAFDTPDMLPWGGGAGYAEVAAMSHYPTLREALIAALVTGKTFADYFKGDPGVWWAQKMEEPAIERLLLACAEVRSRHE
jgi:hypothetical protein